MKTTSSPPKHRIVQQLKYVQGEFTFEKVKDKVSLTIPDQTMSLRELIEMSRAMPSSDDLYLGEDPEINKMADIDRMELTDRNQISQDMNQKVKDLSDQVATEIKANRKKKLKEELKAEMEAEPPTQDGQEPQGAKNAQA